jgi:hypothetical protein
MSLASLEYISINVLVKSSFSSMSFYCKIKISVLARKKVILQKSCETWVMRMPKAILELFTSPLSYGSPLSF